MADAIRALFFIAFFLLWIGGCTLAGSAASTKATVGETYNIGMLNERSNAVVKYSALSVSGAIFLAAWYIGLKLDKK